MPLADPGTAGMDEATPVNLDDYEAVARGRLPGPVFDYYAGGAQDELTLAANCTAWKRLTLHYRVLAGAATCRLETSVLGQTVSMPILVGPTAFQRMACEEGELAAARAARQARTLYVLSTLSTTPMEEVFAQAASPRWFQLYVYRDRGLTAELIARAEAAGAEALMFTVDSPILGRRERDVRNRFRLPPGLAIANAFGAGKGQFPQVAGSGLAAYVAEQFDPALSWEHLDRICASTSLPVVIKGLCRPDDARRALDHGVRGVVVSNHGGRQLDTAPATAEVLEAVAAAVAGRCEVYVDGGIRRGTDVLKALALGARAVFLGRPLLWGLAARGEAGALAVLELLRGELADALALSGCARLADVDRSLVGPA